jgi:quercetin dioxygenase-like cupin family protein
MAKILKITGQEINHALQNVTRQYLVGDLQQPQALQHVPSSLIEIGITRYEKEGKLEPPHWHKQAFEFQYMTAGSTAYLNLTAAEEHIFRKGDFYVIEPGVVYAQKSAPGTEILFVKVPPGQTNEAQFYVSMSRARKAMHLVTDSKAALREAVCRSSTRLSPWELIQEAERQNALKAVMEMQRVGAMQANRENEMSYER